MDNLLPITYLIPGVAWEIKASSFSKTLPGMPRRLLLIGQSDGGVDKNKVITISTQAQADTLLKKGTMLYQMWTGAKANTIAGLPIDVIALADDAKASAAKAKIIITAANKVKAGALVLYIGGIKVKTGVSDGQTLAAINTNLSNAINTDTTLPVTAKVANNKIEITCKWSGDTGNNIDIRNNYYADEATPEGIVITMDKTAGGAVNPDLTPVIGAMKNYRATEIVSPYTDSTSMKILEDELARRWDLANMNDGQLCVSMRGSEAEHIIWLNSRNSLSAHSKHTQNDLTSPWITASMSAAAIESKIAVDPVYPLMSAMLKDYMPAPAVDDLEAAEINNILLAGGSPTFNQNGSGYLGRMVTNRTETNSGADDNKYRNLNWIKTISEWRWYITNKWLVDVIEAGFKVAEFITTPVAGQKIITKDGVQEFMLMHYDQWVNVTRFQNASGYKENLKVEVDGKNGKVKLTEEPQLVTQLYQVEGTTAYRTE